MGTFAFEDASSSVSLFGLGMEMDFVSASASVFDYWKDASQERPRTKEVK